VKKLFLILFVFLSLFAFTCYSQKDTLNYTDANGLKQGKWIYYRIRACSSITLDTTIITTLRIDSVPFLEGFYNNNLRVGEWISYNLKTYNPQMKSTIIFDNDSLTGEFKYYSKEGKIVYQSKNKIEEDNDFIKIETYLSDGRFYKEKFIKVSEILPLYSNFGVLEEYLLHNKITLSNMKNREIKTE